MGWHTVIERLEVIKEKGREQFLKDRDLQDICCYRLLVAIEAVLNLCYHVTAKKLKQVPGEYTECFVILRNAGIIQGDLSERLQRMARFRNLLIHMYWKINLETLYEMIEKNLADLQQFCRIIASLL